MPCSMVLCDFFSCGNEKLGIVDAVGAHGSRIIYY
jgi:hypothetical protein